MSRVLLLLRLLTAAALAVVAAIHLHLAPGYALLGELVTHGDPIRAQAAAAAAVALALLVRPRGYGWLAVAVLGLRSRHAVVGPTYVAVPAPSPFPRIFEPAW